MVYMGNSPPPPPGAPPPPYSRQNSASGGPQLGSHVASQSSAGAQPLFWNRKYCFIFIVFGDFLVAAHNCLDTSKHKLARKGCDTVIVMSALL